MLMDVSAAASMMNVGESTVRRWIREGRVSVVRLGRRVLLRPEALEEFIKTGEQANIEERMRRLRD